MMFEKLTAATMALAVSLPSAALAFDAADWDTDGDGMVSEQEYTVAITNWSKAAYSEADADGDGSLSMDEIDMALENGTLPPQQDR